MASEQYPELGYTPCVNGWAAAIPGDLNNTFKCSGVSLGTAECCLNPKLTFLRPTYIIS
jgi:hypothetical protein